MTDLTTIELFAVGLLHAGDLLTTADPENDTIAEITDDGLLGLGEHTYDSPRRAARAVGNEQTDGWDYWIVHDDKSPRSLRELAEMLPPDASTEQ